MVKPNHVPNMVKSTFFRKDDWYVGTYAYRVSIVKPFVLPHRTVSTPFLYLPHTRPSVPIPVPLVPTASSSGFAETPQWKLFSSITVANRRGMRDLVAKVRLLVHLFHLVVTLLR